FGWDFAPRFLGCGVWKNVKLVGWNFIYFKDIFLNVQDISNDSIVKLGFILNFETTPFNWECQFSKYLKIQIKNGDMNHEIRKMCPPSYTHHEIRDTFFCIYKKKLWNVSDSIANLDSFHISIFVDDTSQNFTINIPIRKVELVQQKDSIGESFYFKLNGKPIFIKGANWVPADVFLPRVSHEKYRNLLTAAKEAGMNMLRVWGGGIYEDEYFYQLCDSLGIIVWQDLPFACSMYPPPSKIFDSIPDIDSISGEVLGYEAIEHKIFNEFKKQNIYKTAFLCGNNEIDEGWKNWGWQQQYHYSKKDSTEIWNNYKELFEEFIPNTLKKMGCDIPYIPSSPKFGWGHKESLTDGDSHYWGVWWGMEPYEMYKKRGPRFASEYGMQSLPCLATIRKFAPDSSLRINSVALRNHQKHPTGFENLDGYLKYYGFKVNGGWVKGRKVIEEYGKGNPDEVDKPDRFQKPVRLENPTIKEFEDYINATQQLQADALRTAITAHMQAQPKCMGTILWQLNEPWPGASWSLIDYYGNKKKAYYEVQKLFKEKK
ncbi:MAG: Exo-beta-D-glucosaminidase, partial [Bacteroidota bacterium]